MTQEIVCNVAVQCDTSDIDEDIVATTININEKCACPTCTFNNAVFVMLALRQMVERSELDIVAINDRVETMLNHSGTLH